VELAVRGLDLKGRFDATNAERGGAPSFSIEWEREDG
jgi:hypothetical protein